MCTTHSFRSLLKHHFIREAFPEPPVCKQHPPAQFPLTCFDFLQSTPHHHRHTVVTACLFILPNPIEKSAPREPWRLCLLFNFQLPVFMDEWMTVLSIPNGLSLAFSTKMKCPVLAWWGNERKRETEKHGWSNASWPFFSLKPLPPRVLAWAHPPSLCPLPPWDLFYATCSVGISFPSPLLNKTLHAM